MATKDRKQTLERRERTYSVFNFFTAVLVAIVIFAFMAVFMLLNGMPSKSAAFENATTVLKILTPPLLVTSVLLFFVATSSRFARHASQKSALPVIQNEIGTIKNIIADMNRKIIGTSPTEMKALEGLVHLLKPLSSEINKPAASLLKVVGLSDKLKLLSSESEEIAALFLKTKDEVQSDKKEQKGFQKTRGSCPEGSNEVASTKSSKISAAAINISTKQKDLSEVLREFDPFPRVLDVGKVDTIEEKSRERMLRVLDTGLLIPETKRKASDPKEQTRTESSGALEVKETQPEVSQTRTEVKCSEETTDETGCSERNDDTRLLRF